MSLAAGLPGLVALAWEALYLGGVRQAVQLIPFRSQAFGSGWEALLFNGVLGAAGLAMIIPLLVPARWRGVGGGGRRDDFDEDLTNAQDFVSGLKESLASATPPRPPAVPTGRTTGGMPRTTGGIPRTGLVGGPSVGGGRSRQQG